MSGASLSVVRVPLISQFLLLIHPPPPHKRNKIAWRTRKGRIYWRCQVSRSRPCILFERRKKRRRKRSEKKKRGKKERGPERSNITEKSLENKSVIKVRAWKMERRKSMAANPSPENRRACVFRLAHVSSAWRMRLPPCACAIVPIWHTAR